MQNLGTQYKYEEWEAHGHAWEQEIKSLKLKSWMKMRTGCWEEPETGDKNVVADSAFTHKLRGKC